MDLTCTSWGDAKDGFEERTVTFTKSECLTYYADEKTVSCASSHTCSRVGIIAQNHTRENGELRLGVFLEWLHMLGELLEPVCQKHRLTNCS